MCRSCLLSRVVSASRRAGPVLVRRHTPCVSTGVSASPVGVSLSAAGSSRRWMSEYASLVHAAKEELEFEQSENGPDSFDADAQDRLTAAYDVSSSDWSSEITLSRSADGETITVVVNAAHPEFLPADDGADAEVGPAPEEGGEPEGEDVYPLSIRVSRGGGRKDLVFDCFAGHGSGLAVRHVHLSDPATPVETLREDAGLYTGPQFTDLDLMLNEAFYNFLAERGLDDAFADDLASMCEAKDQAEYIRWLEGVVEAAQ